ncbi:hypothetical protein [Chitinophaga eiseniae]|uniref:Cytochrome c domain-containing protein n=1 Tax=Chitinophaga eiseniae TaxID=634771 RepID=A0A847SGB7_9BACT|nr:hypothetical protein [Chitinophaga eiseniae]NLR82290.1 hypothetical protein [Chitinophaga eiseniae]
MKKFFGLVCIVIILVIACKKKGTDNLNPGEVDCGSFTTTFSATVKPLMISSCAKSGCHAAGSTSGPGELTTYSQIFNSRAAIRNAVANGTMPRDTTFTAMQKAIITCWIDAGAQNN